MTLSPASIKSILAFDFGATSTRALLVEQVEGQYRFIGRGTAPSFLAHPQNEMMAAARQALYDLSAVTGRHYLNRQGQIISPEQGDQGADAVVAVLSAGQPLRLLLAGILSDVSLASARTALSGTFSVVEDVISLDGLEAGARVDDVQGQIRLIQRAKPDAVVVVGGIDGGPARPILNTIQAIALACAALPEPDRPPIIYAGNAKLRQEIIDLIAGDAELHIVDNVRPTVDVENPGPLQEKIEEVHRLRLTKDLPGYRQMAARSLSRVIPASRALAHGIRYLAQVDDVSVLGLDVGGTTTTAAGVLNNQFNLEIRTDLGLGCSVIQLLDLVPTKTITRWLPFELDPANLCDLLHNKALYPETVPQTREDLLLEQALAREIMRVTVTEMAPRWMPPESPAHPDLLPSFHLIVGGGRVLSHAPSFGQAALMLLDALQPVGVFGLALDQEALLAPLGAMALVQPQAAAQVLEKDGLLNLATVVAPIGSAPEGETALACRVRYEEGQTLDLEVPFGTIRVIPLGTGQTAELELRPSPLFDVGLGASGQAGATTVLGGTIGIIIDARGRPLPFPNDPSEQRERIRRWLADIKA
jgi:hypothetical protein